MTTNTSSSFLITPKRDFIKESSLPSPLLRSPKTPRYIPKLNSLNDLDDKFPAIDNSEEMFGKAGIVYIAESNPGKQTVAIKRQILTNPDDKESTAYRELLIMKQLNEKIKGNHNFIKLLDWNKCWIQATPPRNKKLISGQKHRIQCMNLVMKQAGEPLQNLTVKGKTISFYFFKQILFQVLFSLSKAQEACEFMHNDLHLKNILIDLPKYNNTISKYHSYHSNNEIWYVDSKIIITIVDFGLSRISLDNGDVIHNNIHPVFLPSVDIEHLSSQFSKFKISSWEDTYNKNTYTKSEEKERRSLKRSIMQRMRKGDSPTKLIKHPIFLSMQEKPSLPLDLIVKEPEIYSPPKPKDLPNLHENIYKNSGQLTPLKTNIKLSPLNIDHSCSHTSILKSQLPSVVVKVTKMTEMPKKVLKKIKKVAETISNKENIIENKQRSSILCKRKRKNNNILLPANKKQKIK